ncbi:Flp family type IVb pilin [Cupriavidus sp. 2SB]|uniref:Flp family type IVb pilin n=1 Tax=Cupriavidus sp. 2SB TaxID=2502199 RepID=UPI0010F66912|nr:Flp family type IVb pilin [Cupriavidus sp. 2SB]
MKHLARIHTNKLTKRTQRGATAIEYGLIVGLIALGVVTGATSLGTNLGTGFDTLANKVSGLFTAKP